MLYDKIQQRLVDCGYDEQNDILTQITLQEDEFIVGVQSQVMKGKPAAHVDLQFLIAKSIWIQIHELSTMS